MLHYLEQHGKPVNSNLGKTLTMFNGILIFVPPEFTSFSLEPFSLVQSSKNNFSWYTAVFCSSLQHMTIFTKVSSGRRHKAFLAAFSLHRYMSVQTCLEHFFSPPPEISWWPPASGSCCAWNVHWPPCAVSYDPPAKQQKPFKQVTENHSHLQAQQAAGPLVMIVKHPLTDPHTTKEKFLPLTELH